MSNQTLSGANAANYLTLFTWPKAVQPGALNDNTNPLAYVHELFQLAMKLEAGADASRARPLGLRRPDIGDMPMDERSLKQTFPSLRFAIDCLEDTVRKSEFAPSSTIHETIASSVFPASLPFHFAWEQVKAVLRHRKLFIWDIVRKSDADYPNFTFGNVTSTSLRAAMTLSSGFAPELRALLTANPSKAADSTTWIATTAGDNTTPTIGDLAVADRFRRRLGLSRKQLRQMLAVYQPGKATEKGIVDRQPAVTRSAHVSKSDAPVSSADFGAAFINDGGEALYLRYEDDDESNPLRIEGLTNGHVDRILRILRLHHATKLSFSDIDILVTTALRAEGQSKGLHLTDTTLRALGLFQHLREKYSVTASQFASFIGDIPSSASGRERAFYDTLFNPSGIEPRSDSESVFTIDGTTFDPASDGRPDAIAVRQLSQAFRADEATVRWALACVVEAQALSAPTRSLAVVSACYRLIALPRAVGLKPSEAPMLVAALDRENPSVLRQLAGVPSLDAAVTTSTDALDVIAIVMNAAEWATKHKHRIDALCLPLFIPSPSQPTEPWITATNDAIAALEPVKGERADDDDIVAAAIQQGLQLKDSALSLPLLKWTNRTPESFAATLRALALSKEVVLTSEGTKDVRACLGPDDLRIWSDLERHAAIAKLFGLSVAALSAMVDHPARFNLASAHGNAIRSLDFTTLYQVSRYADWLATMPAGSNEDDAIDYFRQVHERRTLGSKESAAMLAGLTGWQQSEIETIARRIDSKNIPDTVEDLRDVDFTMRLHELAIASELSVDALFDINELKVATTYAAFEKAAAALLAACSGQDALAVEGSHGEAWRDALVAWMLEQESTDFDVDALSDQVLLDVMVGREPTTSRVASTIASLQTYIHRMLAGLEPGHEGSAAITQDVRDTWNASQSQYGRWRLLRQLRNYPENRLDPTSRSRKTKAFADLESLLAQGKFSGDDIGTAILAYMTAAEATSNVQPLTAYHDGVDPLNDTYHFIGKSNVSPPQYYWRTLDMSMRDADDASSMLGFTAWEEISVPLTGVIATTPLPPRDTSAPAGVPTSTAKAMGEDLRSGIDTIRPVVVDGRRYVVWVERDTTGVPMGKNQKTSPYFGLRVCYCYRQLDGLWGPPNVLISLDGLDSDGNFRGDTPKVDAETFPVVDANESATGNAWLKTRKFAPGLIVMVNAKGDRKDDPWFTVLLVRANKWWHTGTQTWNRDSDYFIASRDMLLLEEKQLDRSTGTTATGDAWRKVENALVADWTTLFMDPRVVQHQYIGKLMTIVEQDAQKAQYAIVDSAAAARLAQRCKLDVAKLGTGMLKATMPENRDFIELVAGFDGTWKYDGTNAAVGATHVPVSSGTSNQLTFVGVAKSPYEGKKYGVKATADLRNVINDDDEVEIHLSLEALDSTYADIETIWVAEDLGELGDGAVDRRLVFSTGTEPLEPTARQKRDLAKNVLSATFIWHGKSARLTGSSRVSMIRNPLPTSQCFTGMLLHSDQDACEITVIVGTSDVSGYAESLNGDLSLRWIDNTIGDRCALLHIDCVTDANSAISNKILLSDEKPYKVRFPLTALLSDPERIELEIQGLEAMTAACLPRQRVTLKRQDQESSTIRSGESLTSPLTQPTYGTARLVLRGGISEAGKITLSSEDLSVLTRLGLDALPGFAKNNPTEFAKFRTRLVTDARPGDDILFEKPTITRTKWSNYYITDHSKVDNSVSTVAGRRVKHEIGVFDTGGMTIPTDIDFRKVIELKHHFPDTYMRFMASTMGKDDIVTQATVTLNGQNLSRALIARFPVNQEVEEYVFHLDVHVDDSTEPLGKLVRTYKLKARGGDAATADDMVPSTRLIQNAYQVHYLDMTEANRVTRWYSRKLSVNAIRLNTLLGMRFAALAMQSTHRLIDWDTQNLTEPRMETGDKPDRLDFRSANGLYFWELFFHVPMLVAWKLRATRQYDQAFDWCTRHLFDPFDSAGDSTAFRPPFWQNRPLAELGPALAHGVTTLSGGVDELAYAEPERYRKAVFMFLVEFWRQQGDDFYRQLTRDDINEASNCYRKALRLIGALPEQLTVPSPALPLLANARDRDFLPPVNVAVTDLRDLLQGRLFNIRHGLTIDGKWMDLDLYASADDADSLGNWRTGMLSGTRRIPRIHVPAYRFKHVLPVAKEAVTQLIDMGRQVFHNYEEEYNAGLGVLQQANLIKLSDFTLKLQTEALASARATRETLLASRVVTEQRRQYYQKLSDPGWLPQEVAATIFACLAPGTKLMSIPFGMTGAGISMLPNIFGMAVGGHEGKALPTEFASQMNLAADIMTMAKDELRYNADIQYRAMDWQFNIDQATGDIEVIDRQIEEQDILIRSASLALEEVRARQALMREEYTFMTTGFAIGPTYVWMIAHLSDIYAAAYDAVVSLCLAAQDGWRYETGEFLTQFVKPGAWMDNWRGMLAGDALQRDLLEMEAAYLRRHERRMHIRKVVSLVEINKMDAAALCDEIDKAQAVAFDLPSALYDADFPGHYLRQIVNVSVTFKLASSHEMRSIAAVLTQTRNALLTTPTIEGATYIYDNSHPEHNSVLLNLRQEQKVAVSTTKPIIDIDGYSSLFSLVFGDDRYLPFEGTGAISRWTLSFPGDKATLLACLKSGERWLLEDILITVDYTAADGGETFAQEIKTLRTASIIEATPAAPPPALGDGEASTPAATGFSAPSVVVGSNGPCIAIPPHPSLPARTQVAATFKDGSGSTKKTAPQLWDGKGLSVPIAQSVLAANAGKLLIAGYEVEAAGISSASDSTSVAIPATDDPGGPVYPAPVIPEVRANLALDRRDAPHGASVTVAPWAYIQKDQRIWLRCLGTKADGSHHDLDLRVPPAGVTDEEVSKGLNVTIPLSYLDELGDYGQMRIVLKASLDGSDTESRAATFPELTVDLPQCSTATVISDAWARREFALEPSLESNFGFVATSSDVGPIELAFEQGSWVLNIPAVDGSGKEHRVILDAGRWPFSRDGGGAPARRIGSYRPSKDGDADKSARFAARYLATQNTHLPPGKYTGKAMIHLIGWQKPTVRESLMVEVEVEVTQDTPLAETTAAAPAATPPTAPETAQPAARDGYPPPRIEYDNGTVYTIIPANPAFVPGDMVNIAWKDELKGGLFMAGNLLDLQPDGLKYKIWAENWAAATRDCADTYALVTYTVIHGELRTNSPALRVKLTASGQAGGVVPVAV
ncbi:hypothetical protein J2T07_003692 [Luteibacter jiangsuensis]|uniref:Virulence plasmid A protein n=2 Tax=Luteibacter jiangsuensis TaxID=637577 RepID=A0ABT9T5P0_9GAMM|nr:hypothetical protein [Luteibacter jiangsuensis]